MANVTMVDMTLVDL